MHSDQIRAQGPKGGGNAPEDLDGRGGPKKTCRFCPGEGDATPAAPAG